MNVNFFFFLSKWKKSINLLWNESFFFKKCVSILCCNRDNRSVLFSAFGQLHFHRMIRSVGDEVATIEFGSD
jgi:hypothetical protein